MEVIAISKRKRNPRANDLGSPEVEGQGTTNKETGRMESDSSRKKQKRN
jgi:hypothetical protein